MEEFLLSMGIEEKVDDEVQFIQTIKKVSLEKIERRRIHEEFEQKSLIDKENKKIDAAKRHEKLKLKLASIQGISGYCALVLLENGNYKQISKKNKDSLYKRSIKKGWKIIHVRPVENMNLAQTWRSIIQKKYRIKSKQYALPEKAINKIKKLQG